MVGTKDCSHTSPGAWRACTEWNGCSWHKTAARSQQGWPGPPSEGSECCCTCVCSAQLMGHRGEFGTDGAAPGVRMTPLRLWPGCGSGWGQIRGLFTKALAKGWMEILLNKLEGVFCKHKSFHTNPRAREVSTKQRKQRCLAPRQPATVHTGEACGGRRPQAPRRGGAGCR